MPNDTHLTMARISQLVSVFSVFFAIGECGFYIPKGRTFPIPKNDDPGTQLFLTPYIKSGQIEQARKLSRVDPDIGNIASYSGYLTTNDACGNNLFFWFVPAQQNWTEAPLVLWLQGGPGGSSIYGMFEELGPFNSYAHGLQNRTYSWNVKNNLLFIDQPVGTGYSFTTNGCYARKPEDYGGDLYSAVTQFLQIFPMIKDNRVFITGESYGGHYVPAIAHTILQNNPSADVKVNLAGLMIGDGWTDPREQINYGDYLYQHGLISPEQLKEFHVYQDKFQAQVDAGQYFDAHTTWNVLTELYTLYSGTDEYNYLPQPVDTSNWDEFVQTTAVRRAIHVGPQSFSVEANNVYNYLIDDITQSVKPLVEDILEQIPIVFYVGQVDFICAYPMVINYLRKLDWSGQQAYLNASRAIWYEGQDIAGYVRGEYRLFEVLVRDAGHMVPMDQPFWAYQLANSFIYGEGIFAGKV